ncbi:MAG TPA: hypothetical protein VNG69_04770 [Casimicrobiaceae bacterium]|nr:hypothetical protein [Casimicrobiaceae bacterium]
MTPDRFDLYDVLQALRQAIGFLVAGALVGALVAAVLTYFIMPFASEGMLGLGAVVKVDPPVKSEPPSVPNQPAPPPAIIWPKMMQFAKGLSLPELKTEYPRLDGETFRQFVAARNVVVDSTLARVIRRLANADTRSDVLNPQFGSTRADLRELGDQAKVQEASALGMRIHVASLDREAAQKAVALLGDFVGQEIFESQARGLVARRLEQHESQKLSFDNELLVFRFNIGTTEDKVSRLRALRKEFPDAAGGAGRQVVSIADGGARYLTPTAQIVGLEATISDLRQQIATTERWQKKAELLAGYYNDAKNVLSKAGDSRAITNSLDALIDQRFASAKQDDAVREARNEAALDLYALRTLRDQGLRFVSGPTPAWRDESRVWKNALAGALIGLVIAVLVVLLRSRLRQVEDR